MSITHTIQEIWGAGSNQVPVQVTKSGSVEQNSSLTLGVVTNQAVDLQWAQAKLLSIFIKTDVDCTLKINSSGSPTDTITLAAGNPFVWVKGSGVPYPFTGTAGAVTTAFVTTTVATNVEIRVLLDL
ncbi:hypothetical protein VT84_23425 [Gemmata sp. SH-PL17]|uniref:hypothetical protein n=1 Tax=Gemmata sp. SH-PL17 TaxID=1630693 RepID=UPI00078CF667|nr:hypothetical protein [Gemmata sp. SH-PL17]AMV27370.1 hypothetical protein VT84_23425 [Gemmata sp. SH-PL17]